jgi:4-amino-4-deoxy-L-arabinose transferase-like glycosyltransferase
VIEPPSDLRSERERRWAFAGVVVLAGLAVLALATFRDYGSIWDEEVQFLYGEYVLAWFRSWFRDGSALSFGDLYVYGGLFDALAQLLVKISPLGLYETRHLANAATGLVGLYATWRLGTLVGGAPTGFVALLFLALTPAYYGHAFNNPKDVPFAAFATLAIYLMLRASREIPRVRPALVILTGLALGAALGVRAGGLFLLGYLVVLWGSVAAATSAPRGPSLARTAGAALGASAIAWATMLVFWPWAQLSPIARPIEAAIAATRFRWIGPMLFDGRTIRSDQVPWNYLPTWFAITLPELFFLALGAGAFVVAKNIAARGVGKRTAIDALFLFFCVAFPIGAVLVGRPILYDAHRQFLFVLPPLCVLAAWGLVAVLSDGSVPRPVLAVIALAAAASGAVTAADMIALHPYQTVYFNRLLGGGLAGASSRFETDYWGASYREGVEELVRHYRALRPYPVRIANCSVRHLTSYWLSREPAAAGHFVNVGMEEDPDIVLATTRDGCHRTADGRVLHVVTRQGTPLLYVIERRPRGTWVAGP